MNAHIVYCGHGSKDPRWRRPFDRLLEFGDHGRHQTASVAFLQFLEPHLATELVALCRGGARRIVVLPVFVGGGSHVESDIPAIVSCVRADFPDVRIDVLPSIGEIDDILAVIVQTAQKAAHEAETLT